MRTIFLIMMVVVMGAQAEAGILASSCGVVPQSSQAWLEQGNEDTVQVLFVSNRTALGLTCEETKSLFQGAHVVRMAIAPALVVMATPGVRETMMAELAALGLTFSNPAVLGVTVIGAVGYVTIYFVLQTQIEECERAQTQEAIKREVEAQLALRYNKPIEVKKEK